MSGKISYRVITPFKYNDKQYKKGDTWEPDGGKHDEQIISLEHHVETVDDRIVTRRDRGLAAKKRRTPQEQEDVAAQAWTMRQNGETYKAIGEALGGIPISTVKRYIEKYDAERGKETKDVTPTASGSSKGGGVSPPDSKG